MLKQRDLRVFVKCPECVVGSIITRLLLHIPETGRNHQMHDRALLWCSPSPHLVRRALRAATRSATTSPGTTASPKQVQSRSLYTAPIISRSSFFLFSPSFIFSPVLPSFFVRVLRPSSVASTPQIPRCLKEKTDITYGVTSM